MAAAIDDLWCLVGPGGRHVMVSIAFGRSGGAVARDWWSGHVLARVPGGGYDRTGAVLARAIDREWPELGSRPVDGAGLEAVVEWARAGGVRVYSASDLAWLAVRDAAAS